MTEPFVLSRLQGPAGARGRFPLASGIFVLAFVLSAWVFATIQGVYLTANSVTGLISQTIGSEGIDAAVAQYRSLRERGFPGLPESESDTNGLGYRLLRQGNNAVAIAVFQLNVETHAKSANAYDSLAEAYADAGNKALAIENYRKALALDPDMKSSGIALAALTSVPRKPYSLTVLLHVSSGVVGILFGGLALTFRKGFRRHRFVGSVSVLGMLGVAAFGAYLGFLKAQPSNFLAGALTLYLVATGWAAAKRKDGESHIFDWIGLAVAAAIAAGLTINAIEGLRIGASIAGIFVAFGAVALLAALSDMRMIVRGGVSGAQRIGRHLWRMCFALLIVASSFFLGQSQVFPEVVRRSGVLAAPTVLIVAAMLFWLWRVSFTKAYKTRPQT
jgi:tetratricopeptide (TPR) repeat protein